MSSSRKDARRARADARALASAQVHVSDHAALRARELGFTCQDVARCVRTPEQTYACHGSYGSDRRTYQRKDLAVVLTKPPAAS